MLVAQRSATSCHPLALKHALLRLDSAYCDEQLALCKLVLSCSKSLLLHHVFASVCLPHCCCCWVSAFGLTGIATSWFLEFSLIESSGHRQLQRCIQLNRCSPEVRAAICLARVCSVSLTTSCRLFCRLLFCTPARLGSSFKRTLIWSTRWSPMDIRRIPVARMTHVFPPIRTLVSPICTDPNWLTSLQLILMPALRIPKLIPSQRL